MATRKPAPAQKIPTKLPDLFKVALPTGTHGLLLVDSTSAPKDRQDLASCILDVVESVANDLGNTEDEDISVAKHTGWALCYLISIAKGLLDSLDLGETA